MILKDDSTKSNLKFPGSKSSEFRWKGARFLLNAHQTRMATTALLGKLQNAEIRIALRLKWGKREIAQKVALSLSSNVLNGLIVKTHAMTPRHGKISVAVLETVLMKK